MMPKGLQTPKPDAADNDPASSPGVYKQSFAVRYDYEVHFVNDMFALDQPSFARALASPNPNQRHRFGVVIEREVVEAFPELAARIERYANAYDAQLEFAARIMQVEGGEEAKNDREIVDELHRTMLTWRLDRHAYLVAIGGGAMLDIAGYAAATFHRGLRHVRVPTTVLGQNDSGVGVKNGINAFGLKNLLGTFAPPFAVFNDASFLWTLPERERIAGMAEAVKVALIRDRTFFSWLEDAADLLRAGDREALSYLIRRCAELHMVQIAHGGDPFERGSARPLDFGHWAAHKLETLTQHQIRHGEAVAIGMALDTRYSVLTDLLPSGDEQRVIDLLERLGFTLWHDMLAARDTHGKSVVLAGLEEFREHLGGELTITLLSALGVGIEVHEIDARRVEQAIGWLRERVSAP
jgi:3-dehydroquinate synthase